MSTLVLSCSIEMKNLREMQTFGWETLHTNLRRIHPSQQSELLRLTLREVLGESWTDFERSLTGLSPHLLMAEKLFSLLDDENSDILLLTVNALFNAGRLFQLAAEGIPV